MSESLNALDRAMMALRRSKAATPEFYRQLAQGELWFLLHYHPEIEGETLELKNGMPLPFAVYKENGEEFVMLFSSEARVNEALKAGRVPERTFSAGSMPARQILKVIGHSGLSAIINRSCATGSIGIPPNLMRDLADGSALQPIAGEGVRQQGKIKILNPAAEGPGYQLLFLMEPRDDVLFHDLNMIIQAARDGAELGLGFVSADDGKQISALAPPFFTAPDYRH